METDKEDDKETIMQTGNQMDGCDGTNKSACVVSGAGMEKVVGKIIKNMKLSSSDDFYEKLTMFYESSGLSLIFNFRETKVDLYLFYKDVTERGGYCQVTKDRKWDEVASSLNAESSVSIPPNNVQILYSNLFYQFEQTYYYRTNSKVKETQLFKAAIAGQSSCNNKSSGGRTKKRKRSENNDDGLVEKRVSLQSSSQLPTEVKSMEKNPSLEVPSEETNLVLKTPKKAKETKNSSIKEMKKHRRNAPVGHRTSYMIFFRMECERLRIIHGKGSTGQIRNMANDAWKRLSERDRQPYKEASLKDKERYIREMAEFKVAQDQIAETQSVSASPNLTSVINFAKPSLQTDGDYHVTLPDDAFHVTFPANASDNVVTD